MTIQYIVIATVQAALGNLRIKSFGLPLEIQE